eukprot:s8843_g2.t1
MMTGMVAVVLPAGGRSADQLAVVLAGPGELAVRAAEHRVAEDTGNMTLTRLAWPTIHLSSGHFLGRHRRDSYHISGRQQAHTHTVCIVTVSSSTSSSRGACLHLPHLRSQATPQIAQNSLWTRTQTRPDCGHCLALSLFAYAGVRQCCGSHAEQSAVASKQG